MGKEKGVTAPSFAYKRMKEAVLGKSYSLSLAFVGSRVSRALNKTYRAKNKSADVLSFSLSKTSGEIFIDTATARKLANSFGTTPRLFVGRLFIHGLFHLKGFRHGGTMEEKERQLRKRFRID